MKLKGNSSHKNEYEGCRIEEQNFKQFQQNKNDIYNNSYLKNQCYEPINNSQNEIETDRSTKIHQANPDSLNQKENERPLFQQHNQNLANLLKNRPQTQKK